VLVLRVEKQRTGESFIVKSFVMFIIMRQSGHVALMGEERTAHSILVWKSKGKRPRGRP
jgi:hypothetical protein